MGPGPAIQKRLGTQASESIKPGRRIIHQEVKEHPAERLELNKKSKAFWDRDTLYISRPRLESQISKRTPTPQPEKGDEARSAQHTTTKVTRNVFIASHKKDIRRWWTVVFYIPSYFTWNFLSSLLTKLCKNVCIHRVKTPLWGWKPKLQIGRKYLQTPYLKMLSL